VSTAAVWSTVLEPSDSLARYHSPFGRLDFSSSQQPQVKSQVSIRAKKHLLHGAFRGDSNSCSRSAFLLLFSRTQHKLTLTPFHRVVHRDRDTPRRAYHTSPGSTLLRRRYLHVLSTMCGMEKEHAYELIDFLNVQKKGKPHTPGSSQKDTAGKTLFGDKYQCLMRAVGTAPRAMRVIDSIAGHPVVRSCWKHIS
jgi:hypothetical protein